jgi:ornithine cyclodeaminase/alanine dehydrogenase-like protein (mu-crystallin family)
MTDERNDSLLYLSRQEVELACRDIDSVAVVKEVFRMHATGQTVLPDEAYLGWTNKQGEHVRSLNMPGYLGGSWQCAGTKIINGNNDNGLRGLPRASGLTHLFDSVSGRISCIMEGAYISSLRTASVSLLAAELFKGKEITCAVLIGAGVQAQAHIELLVKRRSLYPSLRQIILFDVVEERAARLRGILLPALATAGIDSFIASTAEEAVRSGQLIVTVTTTTTGYIQYAWLQPGAVFVNISLDDPLPEVVLRADKVIVDDWTLVRNDTRRLLGRMYRAKQILGPDEPEDPTHLCRRVDAQLGEIITGQKVGREKANEILLVNPFGIAIEDVALASIVYQEAQKRGLGTWLAR